MIHEDCEPLKFMVLMQEISEYNGIAVCCKGFFGFLYVNKFTVLSPFEYVPDTQLSLSHVTLDNIHAPYVGSVTAHQAVKDRSFQIRAYIHLGRTHPFQKVYV